MDLNKLSEMLKVEEGLRLKPYTDSVGKLTIGYGRNLDDVGISETEAAFFLGNDMAKHALLLDKNIPWWQNLDDVRQRVLCDMCFNMGWGDGTHGLSSFPNFLEHVRLGQYKDAAQHGRNSHWFNQVGRRGVRLMLMMETGQDQKY